MAITKIQLTPETFNLDPTRFEFKQEALSKEFIDEVVSTIFLAQNYNSIASRNLEKQTLNFKGTYSKRAEEYLKNFTNIFNQFNSESQVSSNNVITVLSPESQFIFDPITRVSRIDDSGVSFYQYYFEINFVS